MKKNICVMKNMIMILLLAIGYGATAQEIVIEPGNFSDVIVSRGLTVNFTKADSNRVVITGTSSGKVKADVEKGVLRIRTSLEQLLQEDTTVVNVYYKQMQSLEARHNSRVEICGKIYQSLLRVKAREGAIIIATIEVENLVANILTGGLIQISGNADVQEIDVKATGEFRGENLIGNYISVNVNGGGTANVFSTEYVNATVRAGSTVYIYGDPSKIEEKTSFGGTIKRIN